MADYVIVTTTADTADEAQSIADTAVEKRLAACAHVRETNSTYWWDGAIQHEQEWEVQLKTRADLTEPLSAHILGAHSYSTPQVIVTPINGGSPAYLAWITAETTPH
jgi:periplasmic divalent cation tolerance protein